MTNLACAMRQTEVASLLFVDFGQPQAKGHGERLQAACDALRLPLQRVRLSGFLKVRQTPRVAVDHHGLLLGRARLFPLGLLLSMSAYYLRRLEAEMLVVGAKRSFLELRHASFRSYTEAWSRALGEEVGRAVRLQTYTWEMTGKEMVGLLHDLKFPRRHVWVCEKSLERACGQCRGCADYRQIQQDIGLKPL